MTKDEAMQQALEALEVAMTPLAKDRQEVLRAITALRTAMLQPPLPEQEPLEYWNAVEGWVKIDEVRKHFNAVGCGTIYKTAGEDRVPLYTAPPQREWVGLTVTTILNMMPSTIPADYDGELMEFAQAIEAKLKEKNHG